VRAYPVACCAMVTASYGVSKTAHGLNFWFWTVMWAIWLVFFLLAAVNLYVGRKP